MNKPKIILSDFDGTLTDHTEFSTKFLDILKLSKENSLPFIIITGRSISWAHFFLTHFSDLSVVVSEGGGSLSYRAENGLILDEHLLPDIEIRRLEHFAEQVLIEFPGLKLTADSVGRKTDRAIELCDLEDPKLLSEVQAYFDKENVNYSTSNVHLNFWCDDLSKFNAANFVLDKFFKGTSLDDAVFFGDSLNDQSLFKEMKHSVGVSNISEVINRLENKPSIILEGDENRGPSGVLNYLKSIL